MDTNSTGDIWQTAMTEYLTSTPQTTRSQTKVTDSNTLELEKQAINWKLMNEDKNYFTAFPAQMIQIATEMNVTPTPGLIARTKAWEDVETMAHSNTQTLPLYIGECYSLCRNIYECLCYGTLWDPIIASCCLSDTGTDVPHRTQLL